MSKKLTYGSENVTSLYVGTQKVKKIYAGSELVYESTPPVMPVKGNKIAIKIKSANEHFVVLDISGTIAKLISLSYTTGVRYDSYVDIYDGSNIQKYLNETFYNTLNANAKIAIQPVNLPAQGGYAISGVSSQTYLVIKRDGTSQKIVNSKTFRTSTNQRIYLPAIQDFGDYLGATSTDDASTTPFTYTNMMTLLYGSTTQISASVALRDRQNSSETSPLVYSLSTGAISTTTNGNTSNRIHYIVNIDLSKIPFEIVT